MAMDFFQTDFRDVFQMDFWAFFGSVGFGWWGSQGRDFGQIRDMQQTREVDLIYIRLKSVGCNDDDETMMTW